MQVERFRRFRTSGMYEPGETPVMCGKCKSSQSIVKNVWLSKSTSQKMRKRECACGNIYVTSVPVPECTAA